MAFTQPQKLTPIRKEYIWGTEDWMLSWFNEGMEQVPLLIKIIKAREALSVQVHPGDEFAREEEHKNGKTEMWYVLDCEPGAYFDLGFKNEVDVRKSVERVKDADAVSYTHLDVYKRQGKTKTGESIQFYANGEVTTEQKVTISSEKALWEEIGRAHV